MKNEAHVLRKNLKKNRYKTRRIEKKQIEKIITDYYNRKGLENKDKELKTLRRIWAIQFQHTAEKNKLLDCITWLVELLNENNGTLCERCQNNTKKPCNLYDEKGSIACAKGIIYFCLNQKGNWQKKKNLIQ